jgi:hypothetical protein
MKQRDRITYCYRTEWCCDGLEVSPNIRTQKVMYGYEPMNDKTLRLVQSRPVSS